MVVPPPAAAVTPAVHPVADAAAVVVMVHGKPPRKADTDGKGIELDFALDLPAAADIGEEEGAGIGLRGLDIVAEEGGIDTRTDIPPAGGSAADIGVEVDKTPHNQRYQHNPDHRRRTAAAVAQKDAEHTAPERAEAQGAQQDSHHCRR